jgi:hypothetical protein
MPESDNMKLKILRRERGNSRRDGMNIIWGVLSRYLSIKRSGFAEAKPFARGDGWDYSGISTESMT